MTKDDAHEELFKCLQEEAEHHFPRECVGLLVANPPYFKPLRNAHPNPQMGFLVDCIEIAQCLHQSVVITGIYHSHPHGGSSPSSRDESILLAENWRYWLIEGPSWRIWRYRWRAGRFCCEEDSF